MKIVLTNNWPLVLGIIVVFVLFGISCHTVYQKDMLITTLDQEIETLNQDIEMSYYRGVYDMCLVMLSPVGCNQMIYRATQAPPEVEPYLQSSDTFIWPPVATGKVD